MYCYVFIALTSYCVVFSLKGQS